MYFKEDKRGLVLNVTNKNFLVMLTRSKNPADAIGLRVMLVAVEAEYQGKPCMALRLRRPPAAGEAAPQAAAEVARAGQAPPARQGCGRGVRRRGSRRSRGMSAATPVRPLPPAVRDKLGKLLPLLSSDHDGERAGAVAAIGRVLKGANLDWIDLSGHIAAPPAARCPLQARHPDADARPRAPRPDRCAAR